VAAEVKNICLFFKTLGFWCCRCRRRRGSCRRCRRRRRNSDSRSISDSGDVAGTTVGYLVVDDPLVSGVGVGVGRLRSGLRLRLDSNPGLPEDGVGVDLVVVGRRVLDSLRSKPF